MFQNLAYTQLRNVSESSTLAIKRLIKGLTSKQSSTNVLEIMHMFDVVAAEFNNTPFLEPGTEMLFAPIDGIMPRTGIKSCDKNFWTNKSQMKLVRELAEKGKDIEEQVRRSLVETFVANTKFWKPKSFKHRNSVDPSKGDMVQIAYSGKVGIVTGVKPQILSV